MNPVVKPSRLHCEVLTDSVGFTVKASQCDPAGRMTNTDAGGVLTAGQVGQRLGLKAGMVRRYALALEEVTGISLELDGTRGRLYPEEVVRLLEATRAHLLVHPSMSVQAAMRAVTGRSEADVAPPARLPGTVNREDLAAVLSEAMAPALAPLLQELAATRAEVASLRASLNDLPQQLATEVMRDLPPGFTADQAEELAARFEGATARALEGASSSAFTPGFTSAFAKQTAADLAPLLPLGPQQELLEEVAALRSQVARLEVTAHAAASAEAHRRRRGGLLDLLSRFLSR
ncbi:hypothetical protein [Deinococcus sp. PEB2-63]